jgi:hypothetical protein
MLTFGDLHSQTTLESGTAARDEGAWHNTPKSARSVERQDF